MTERELKQQEELSHVFPLLRDLGIAEGLYRCDDKPDVIVEFDCKLVGIEVVTYRAGNNAELENALQKALDEYAREFDKTNDVACDIYIVFHGAEVPAGLNVRQNKGQIFNEIDNCRFNREEALLNQFVSEVVVTEIPEMSKSFVSFPSAFIYEDTVWESLQRCISVKERKLEEYKKLSKNKDISEWWLFVYYPTVEHSDYRNLVLPDGFSSTYDRVYLSEPCRYKEIFRKNVVS